MLKGSGTRATGNLGEDIACQFLERKGFLLLERNYRKPWGEVDIIAIKDEIVRFIEVKAVSREPSQGISREIGEYRPEEMVHEQKLRKISKVADFYMNNKKDPRDYQIDVVGVILDRANKKAKCRLFEQVL